jgi:hypothetical protein
VEIYQVIQQQQKNMMEALGQSYKFGYSKKSHSRIRYSTSALGMGGETTVIVAATEEWTGAGAAVTKTITVS